MDYSTNSRVQHPAALRNLYLRLRRPRRKRYGRHVQEQSASTKLLTVTVVLNSSSRLSLEISRHVVTT